MPVDKKKLSVLAKRARENKAIAKAIIERVNREEAAKKIYEEKKMGEQPLQDEHPLASVIISGATGNLIGNLGVRGIGQGLARGLEWVGEKAMPSALLRGAATYLPETAGVVNAVAPWADAAALAHWSVQGARAAREAAERGDRLGAVTYGGLAALPVAMPLAMRGSQAVKNLGKGMKGTLELSSDEVAPVAPNVIADESHQNASIMSAKAKFGLNKKAQQDVVDLFSGDFDEAQILSDSKSKAAWKSTLERFVDNKLGKDLEGGFGGITNYAQNMLNKIKYSELNAVDKKKFDFIKNHSEFSTMMADESDIFDMIKLGEKQLESDFPGYKQHMLHGASQDKLIETYIKEHLNGINDFIYQKPNSDEIDPAVFKEGLTEGLEVSYPGITKFVKEHLGAPESEPGTFLDRLKKLKNNRDLSNAERQQALVDLLESDEMRSKVLSSSEIDALSDHINNEMGTFHFRDDLIQPEYPFIKTDNGYVVKGALKNKYPLGDYIRKHLNNVIRVRQTNRDAVNQILSRVRSGEEAPLDLAAKDIFGRDIVLPEEYAASMRLPEYQTAFPNGAEYFWRGDDSPVLYNNNYNTGYSSLFGGDFDMAQGYNRGNFSGGATPISSVENTMSPNMFLYAVPKGTLLDLGKFYGANWRNLPEATSAGQNVQLKINAAYAGKKANSGYPTVLAKLQDEINTGEDWIRDHPFRFDTQRLRALNPETIPSGFTFNEATKFPATDSLSDYVRAAAGTPEFPFQGVILRGIHDGSLSGNAANEVIYNIFPGAGKYTPKLVSPNSTFMYGFNGKPLAKGGSIHIKPSHRGRLTELKARTGKTEAELYNDGNPAHKKMVVFARNSRKWHADGGLLADAPADMEYANKWDRISNARYTMANNALLRSGSNKRDADRLARFLAAQSALEAGWVDESKGNNYAGYMSNGKRMSFDSADAFWDYHVKNLDERWPGWRESQSIDDYYNLVNHTDLGLTTKALFDDYNKNHRDAPVYIYAPDWENENYYGKLKSVYDKYIGKYVKHAFDAGGFMRKHGKDKILAVLKKMKQSN